MSLTLSSIIKESETLPLVPLKATTAYHENLSALTKIVDDTLSSHPKINDLIGNNPLQVMYDNHKHHAAFMTTVFSIGQYELLSRTIPWVYRAYSQHNFLYDYFPIELNAWKKALEKTIDKELIQEIQSIYSWMIKKHEDMITLSQNESEMVPPISEDWLESKNSFLAALLDGNHHQCLNIAKESVSISKDVEPFYLNIIQSVMYEIGMLWERGEISAAQEHLASAIVGRVMATTSMTTVSPQTKKGKVIITSAPDEFHEIGAWMLSDILEQEGWNIRYLGANTPMNDLLEMLESFKPNILALSVTMPFNILKAKDIISTIKKNADFDNIKILIGGRVFNDTPDLWRSTGADYCAANIHEAKKITEDLIIND